MNKIEVFFSSDFTSEFARKGQGGLTMSEKTEFEWKRQTTYYHQKVKRDNKFIETGKGNLLPLISESKDDYSLIIVDTKAGKEPFSIATPQEQIERISMQKSEPVFAFYFPKTEGGKSSVKALIEWLQEIQEYLEESV